MTDKQKFKYGEGVNCTDPNTSHSRMVALVGDNKTVLEFGCASGYMSRVLREHGCRVTGIELDHEAARLAAEHCERVIEADLSGEDWMTQLGNTRFDVAVFGDVLEHLADPEATLRRAAHFLKPNGYVVVSIPNIAHGSVRLALLSGEFRYRNLGLLDHTHLRFFTRESVHELFARAGYLMEELQTCRLGIFDGEVRPKREALPDEAVAYVEKDQEALDYQFVCKGRPAEPAEVLAGLARDVCNLLRETNQARQQLEQTNRKLQRAEDKLQETEETLRVKNSVLTEVLNSKGWRMLNKYRELKVGVRRNRLVHVARRLASRRSRILISQQDYQRWYQAHEAAVWAPRIIQETSRQFSYRPTISIILPVFNTPKEYLEQAVQSVQRQHYENWELCICDDASTAEHIRPMLEALSRDHARIKVVWAPSNGGISAASNLAIKAATGEFIGFLDHDDELSPAALYEMVKLLQKHPEADVIYSDEDKLESKGKRSEPFFKPDWSPEYALSCNYVCHFGLYRRKLVDEAGGLRSEFNGSQDYDLLLRIVEKTPNVFHIPEILYHWRKARGSTAKTALAKLYSTDAGQRALQEHLQRQGLPAHVLNGEYPNRYRVRPTIRGNAKISVIIPTRDGVEVLGRCIHSIETRTDYPNYEILIVDNGSSKPESLKFFSTLRHRVLRLNEPFNYSRLNNFGAQHATGDFLLLLNNDTEVISPEWMRAMLELCHFPGVGIAGAKLYYPDGRIQHAGVVLGIQGVAGHSHKYFPRRSRGYFDSLVCIRNYSAVTAACLMVRRDAFEAVGGFDEELKVAFNDVDFCLRVRDKGYRVAWTPHAELYHHESASRGFDLDVREIELMKQRWGERLVNDPYYNRNLTLQHENFSIRF
jgi:GT2 family glycosyltransferase/2-polyprenyl-3-methyl-5-hydroxy-6-metoxy-1,4-benzoquinol methylase